MIFYITFGQKYRGTPHPTDNRVHPDGWVEIEASSRAEARNLAFKHFREYWACLYSDEEMDERAKAMYERGCIFTI